MATVHRNREIKRWCADFRPIRQVLRQLGARPIPVKTQVDTYYRLGREPNTAKRRLKFRVEPGRSQLISYADEYASGLRSVRYVVVELPNSKLRSLLEFSLGISAVVRKRREVWRLPRVLFNLDRVEGVGSIFEIEVVLRQSEDADELMAMYLAQFGAYLGDPINASNEDLVVILAGGPHKH